MSDDNGDPLNPVSAAYVGASAEAQMEAVMSTHTPGPWRPGRGLEGECLVRAEQVDGQPYVALVFKSNDDYEANARLIAAAPELLGLLIDVLPVLEADLTLNDDPQILGELKQLIARIKTIRAKVEGNQPKEITHG